MTFDPIFTLGGRRYAQVWASILKLWRLCGNARCRRARRCNGDPRVCFEFDFPLLPEDVQNWFWGVGEGRVADEPYWVTMEKLNASPAGAALRGWHAAVADSIRQPARRKKDARSPPRDRP